MPKLVNHSGVQDVATVLPAQSAENSRHGDQHQDVTRHIRANVAGLRRFARLLTGQHRFANLCVVRLIEDVATTPGTVLHAKSPKKALYKHLLSIINSTGRAREIGPGIHWSTTGQQLVREAHLLAAVEGFTPLELACILEVNAERVEDLLEQSLLSERSLMPAQILIIEDEPLISWQIERLVVQLGHEIIGVATTRKQSAKFLKSCKPNIVLADVQLADGSTGIDSVTDILSQFEVPAIFVTADPDRLSTGTIVEPIFVVAKPFAPAALKAVICQVLFLTANPQQIRYS